nr:odorant receptor 40 [Graphosoma rubrolineatum]
MDPPCFAIHFRPLLVGLRRCGMPTPWLKKSSSIWRSAYLFYDMFLMALVAYILSCYVYTIMTMSIPFQDLCGLGVSTSNYLSGFLATIHQSLFRARLKRLTDKLDNIAKEIIFSGLGEEHSFLRLYNKNAKLMTTLVNKSVILGAMAPPIYCLSVPAMDWFAGQYRSHFPVLIESPFDERAPVVYEVVVLLVAACMSASIAKKVITDCLFISLFQIEIAFLKYLSLSLTNMKKEFLKGDGALIDKKLKLWIKLHQSVLRSINELILISSPVVIFYYVTVICIVVCGTFVQIMKDNDNIFQSLSISVFISITLVYYFLLANTADQLTVEGQNLAHAAYDTPWYQMKKRHSSLIRMIITISSRPIQLTAYSAPVFLLNRENFAGFVVSAISAFVTFCQMKALYG